MKYRIIIFSILFGLLGSTSAFAFGSINQAAILQTRYCPQASRWNNMGRQQRNYIYSAQQAKYYGYRVPENTTNTSSYYNPYRRSY